MGVEESDHRVAITQRFPRERRGLPLPGGFVDREPHGGETPAKALWARLFALIDLNRNFGWCGDGRILVSLRPHARLGGAEGLLAHRLIGLPRFDYGKLRLKPHDELAIGPGERTMCMSRLAATRALGTHQRHLFAIEEIFEVQCTSPGNVSGSA